MEGETAYIMSGGNSLCFLLGAILPIFVRVAWIIDASLLL
jgi:hypothetical protein